MKWYDIMEDSPTICRLHLCKSIYGEYDLLVYMSESKMRYNTPCVWEGNDGEFDYREASVWRYWIDIDEIEEACEEGKP